MVSVLGIVYEHPTRSERCDCQFGRQVPPRWIDARHPDSDTSGALQIETADSYDCLRITSPPEVNFQNSLFTADSSISRYRFGSCRRKQQATRDECGEAWLDTERDEIGGHYCEDCHVGRAVPDDLSVAIIEGVRGYAIDPNTAEALWKKSEEMVRESF